VGSFRSAVRRGGSPLLLAATRRGESPTAGESAVEKAGASSRTPNCGENFGLARTRSVGPRPFPVDRGRTVEGKEQVKRQNAKVKRQKWECHAMVAPNGGVKRCSGVVAAGLPRHGAHVARCPLSGPPLLIAGGSSRPCGAPTPRGAFSGATGGRSADLRNRPALDVLAFSQSGTLTSMLSPASTENLRV
jgi:hypothetical protein